MSDAVIVQTEEDALIALPEDRLVKATGISRTRLRRWEEKFELVRPSVKQQLSQRNVVRLYGFSDALEVLVVNALLERDFHVRQILRVIHHLRSRGYDRPLRDLKFAVLRR